MGADLANVVNEAALLGVRRDRERVGMAELQEAVERMVAGLEKKNRVLTARREGARRPPRAGHALVALAFPTPSGSTRSPSSPAASRRSATRCRCRPRIAT